MTKFMLIVGASMILPATSALADPITTTGKTVSVTVGQAVKIGDQSRSKEVTTLKIAVGNRGNVAKIKALNDAGTKGVRPLVNVSALNQRGGKSGRLVDVSVLNGSNTSGPRAPVSVSVKGR
ncbi:MAG: hypothetical protein H0T82_05075 [Sphingomonas sp.]|nr:hypothetical protein [Sphingomonas sp.]